MQHNRRPDKFVPTIRRADAQAYSRHAGAYHAKVRSANKKRNVLIVIAAAVALVIVGAGAAFGLYMNHVNTQLTHGDKTEQELMKIDDALSYTTSLDEPFYMLLIGSDKREGDEEMGARSDTNIVVRIDPDKDIVTMVSIPRDTKIEIPGYGTQKFNAAYAFDGAAGTIKAAEKLLNIDISHYAEVNFQELSKMVDAVGGVTVEVEETIDDWKCDDGDGNHYIIKEGIQTLSGGEALTFARSRDYPDGDYRRQMHQRQLIEAIVDKVLDAPITSIPSIIDAASKCVTTDLNVFDVIGLAQKFAGNKDMVIYSAVLPSYPQMINGISFILLDDEKTKEMLKVVAEGKDPSDIVTTMTGSDTYSYDSSFEASSVLLLNDDDEVATGTYESTYSYVDGAYTDTTTTNTSTSSSSSGAFDSDLGVATDSYIAETDANTTYSENSVYSSEEIEILE